ncbi:hypothetical protein [Glycomyces tenuis]|nr:hypothetical protein [Glycomyces tenuis]
MRERRGIRPAWKTRLVAGAAGAVLAVAVSPAHAQDDEGSGAERLCGLHDFPTQGASGITSAGDDGWWVVSGGDNQDTTLSVLRIGADCSMRPDDEAWIEHDPRDPQALATDSEGYLWIADTGEALDRDSIAVNWVDPEDRTDTGMYRFVFPEGPEETEAFVLLPETDTPLFITAGDGEANLYGPSGEMLEYDTPMENLGAVALSEGGSVTGAAVNADGTKVVLRTADTAYEWAVEGGDVVGALTGAEPTLTPLASEGEAQDITYDAEGNFNTLARLDSEDTFAQIDKYTPAAPPAAEPSEESGGDQASGGGDEGGGIVDFILGLGFDTIVRILAGIAVVGFLVMLGGILAIRKSRRARDGADEDDTEMGFAKEEPVFGDVENDPVDIGLDSGQPDPEVGQLAQGGAVYGAQRAEPSGNVYGGAKGAEPSGNVYGGARPEASGSVYGSAPPEPRPEPPAPAPGGGRSEPQYGAFEGAGQGSIYNNAGESFAVEPPAGGAYGAPRQSGGAVYGGGEATGSTYGSPREPGGAYGGSPANVESTGTVYGSGGGRTQEPDEDYWGPPDGGGRRR